MNTNPVLYSFRRCPYAMRARLALFACEQVVELREIILRDKPPSMLEASPKGTVPVMIDIDQTILEESLDIISWSLKNAKADSEASHWKIHLKTNQNAVDALIADNDGWFKEALDAYKYPEKFPEFDRAEARQKGSKYIQNLNSMLESHTHLFGNEFTMADAAILPFVRQFAHVDQEWFYAQDWENVITWLDNFKQSERFAAIMPKFKQWRVGDDPVWFGDA